MMIPNNLKSNKTIYLLLGLLIPLSLYARRLKYEIMDYFDFIWIPFFWIFIAISIIKYVKQKHNPSLLKRFQALIVFFCLIIAFWHYHLLH